MGMLKDEDNKQIFVKGLNEAINKIEPKAIIVYGFVTKTNIETIFKSAIEKGIKLIIPHSTIDRYKKEDAVYGVR